MNGILNQLKAWRSRWNPRPTDTDDDLNRSFAATFGNLTGKEVLDYLIEKYYIKPVEFIGPCDPYLLAEHNGQMKLMTDILTRTDIGLHPMLHKPEPPTEEELRYDARQ